MPDERHFHALSEESALPFENKNVFHCFPLGFQNSPRSLISYKRIWLNVILYSLFDNKEALKRCITVTQLGCCRLSRDRAAQALKHNGG